MDKSETKSKGEVMEINKVLEEFAKFINNINSANDSLHIPFMEFLKIKAFLQSKLQEMERDSRIDQMQKTQDICESIMHHKLREQALKHNRELVEAIISELESVSSWLMADDILSDEQFEYINSCNDRRITQLKGELDGS